MIRRILIGLDGSAIAETILLDVQVLAARVGAEVVLLHVTHVPEGVRATGSPGTIDDIVEQEQAKAQSYLDGVARRLADAGLKVQTALRAGQTAAEIIGFAERERIDLIALATHGRSGIQRWMHGSIADAVLHATNTPLLLLQPAMEGSAASLGSGAVVVPLDGSATAEVALPLGEDLSRALGVSMVLVRVVEVLGLSFSVDPMGGAYVDYQAVLDVLRVDAARYLEDLAGRIRARGLEVAVDVRLGFPVDGIAANVREHPGSVAVLATHGRTGWRELVLGSVTRRFVVRAPGPVIVVPAREAKP